jgi:transcriptional regulator with XRE-family HTH domain
MEIATVIREGRRKKRLSQRALATKLGVSAGAVGQWETGATNPSISNRVDLASVLDVRFSDLLPEIDSTEITSKDPQTIKLVRQFEALPAPIRESILMQVVATVDAIDLSKRPDPAKK